MSENSGSAAAAMDKQAQRSLQQAFEHAVAFHGTGQLPQAIEIYQQLILLRPDWAQVYSNLAAALQAQGKLAAAVASYREALRLMPDVALLHSNLGTALHAMGLAQDAKANYVRALELDGGDVHTYCHLAAACEDLGELTDALDHCQNALQRDPASARAHNIHGNVLRRLGRLQDALSSYHAALNLKPDYVLARENLAAAQAEWGLAHRASTVRDAVERNPREAAAQNDLGNALKSQGELEQAIAAYRHAIELNPGFVKAHNNLGVAYAERQEFESALSCYERALQLDSGYSEAHNNLGTVYLQLDNSQRAAACFQQAIRLRPDVPEYHANLASAFLSDDRAADAVASLKRALVLAPDRSDFHRNLGSALLFQRRYDEAIEQYRHALMLQPRFPEAMRNLADALSQSDRREEAIVWLRKSLQLVADDFEAASVLAHHLQHLFDWEEWAALERRVLLPESLSSSKISLFGLLSIASTPQQQLSAAQACFLKPGLPLADRYRSWTKKGVQLRLGYFSADYRDHPVAHLLSEVLELHDRSQVEVYAYSCFGRDDRSAPRERIRAAVDHFVDVETLSAHSAAQRIFDDGIDILIDLGGYTQHSRTKVMARHPAPIQVNYLGYPGTMGAPFMDYIITDRFVTPPQAQAHFSEKFAYLPHCFQPNDSKRAIAPVPEKAACGLPAEGFVFCCFNRNYKLTPAVFEVWMRLLRAVPGSVLWLSDTGQTAKDNLLREAQQRRIEASRLIFAPRVDTVAQHLGRQRHADLFLDTLPYNAHTTASDALWAGLPVLTCAGETFASRVAGSLLHAIGLPELVTSSLGEYETLALKLAREPELMRSYRERLQSNRLRMPLFDSARYVKALERVYQIMWEHHVCGRAPQIITVSN